MNAKRLLLAGLIFGILATWAVAEGPAPAVPAPFDLARANLNPNSDHSQAQVTAGTAESFHISPGPPRPDYADMLARIKEKSDAFSFFLSAVSKAHLEHLLSSKGPFTLFLPTDEAFSKMPKDEREAILNDPTKCQEFVMAHLVRGKVRAQELAGAGVVTTAQGAAVSVVKDEGNVWVGNARIVFRDVPAQNGLIQVVNAVLQPGIQVALH
jgi:uncharacterized surface protein with fasciclin (FAS1) repeats